MDPISFGGKADKYKMITPSQESSLGPNPIAFCIGNMAVVTAFDATKPANTRFRVNILSAIQPAAVYGALHGVYAGLVDGVCVVGHSSEHVITVGCVIPNAAPYGTAMV